MTSTQRDIESAARALILNTDDRAAQEAMMRALQRHEVGDLPAFAGMLQAMQAVARVLRLAIAAGAPPLSRWRRINATGGIAGDTHVAVRTLDQEPFQMCIEARDIGGPLVWLTDELSPEGTEIDLDDPLDIALLQNAVRNCAAAIAARAVERTYILVGLRLAAMRHHVAGGDIAQYLQGIARQHSPVGGASSSASRDSVRVTFQATAEGHAAVEAEIASAVQALRALPDE